MYYSFNEIKKLIEISNNIYILNKIKKIITNLI